MCTESSISVYRAIRQHLKEDQKIVVIHSSMPEFSAYFCRDIKNELIHAISKLVAEGWTFAISAFTFSFCEGKPYHHFNSKSEVGVLADWILDEGASRTRNPIYSFVVVGDDSEKLMKADSTTAFGEGSIFEIFEKENALQLQLGCDQFCTLIHRCEEVCKVQYRYMKKFRGRAVFDHTNHECTSTVEMYVKDLSLNPVMDVSPAFKELAQKGHLVDTLGGLIKSVDSHQVVTTCIKQIKRDPNVYLKRKKNNEKIRVAVLGMMNVLLIKKAILEAFKESDVEAVVYSTGYGQLQKDVLDPSSRLYYFNPDYIVFSDRLEDIFNVTSLDEVDSKNVNSLLKDYDALINKCLNNSSAHIIVCKPSYNNYVINTKKANNILVQANCFLSAMIDRDHKKRLMLLSLFNISQETDGITFDSKLWHIGKFPFSRQFSKELGKRIVKTILSRSGQSIRMILVDLDNTLWGGIVGEDGIENIKASGDYPGSAFNEFQVVLKQLSKIKGIPLGIVSKNDESLVLDTFKLRTDMHLKMSDFVAVKVSWNSKVQSISEICETMNLGLKSILFIDDNPVERLKIKNELPDVKILELDATDPTSYTKSLLSCPWIDLNIEVSREDTLRVEMYKSRSKMIKEKSNMNEEDFFKTLNTKIYIQDLSVDNISRAEQLCMKTNQFNTTTKRYTVEDLRKIEDDGGKVFVIAVEDKYMKKENVGLVVLKEPKDREDFIRIDSYILSCRVLGRGIETVIPKWLHMYAKSSHKNIEAKIQYTEKNTPVRKVFKDAGYSAAGGIIDQVERWWRLNYHPDSTIPDYVTIVHIDPLTPQSHRNQMLEKDKHISIVQTLNEIIDETFKKENRYTGFENPESWDSIKQIEILLLLEERLGIKFPPSEFKEAKTTNDIVESIKERIKDK